MAAVGAPPPTAWRAWWRAARPRTLPVAAAPVWVGTALALSDGRTRALPALAALLGALWLQVGANFANDLFDAERGADPPERLGPPRAVAAGWLSPAQMRAGTGLAFAAAAAAGTYLIAVGGWPIALAGLASIAAGLAYSGGPFPLGYHGLGELAVFLFFGVIAVCGSYWVQALALTPAVFACSLPIGSLAAAVLVVNNVRDIDSDRRAGKRTLAVRLGRRGARIEYAALALLPYAALPALSHAAGLGPGALLPLFTLPWALALVRQVWSWEDGPRLNAALAATARLELGFAALLGLGVWL